MTSGIDFYRLADRLESDFENCREEMKEKLSSLMKMIFTEEKLLVNLTCKGEAKDAVLTGINALKEKLYRRNKQDKPEELTCLKQNEGFMDATQVQYVSAAGNFKKAGYSYTGAFQVLKTILSYEYLWLQIRVKGGAFTALPARFCAQGTHILLPIGIRT